jgi:hypothetical protein
MMALIEMLAHPHFFFPLTPNVGEPLFKAS